MGHLEYQRELSPDQLREALSLLDNAAGVKGPNTQSGNSNSAEKAGPGVDQASKTASPQGQLSARVRADPTKHLNVIKSNGYHHPFCKG